jgi:hypothetical protein
VSLRAALLQELSELASRQAALFAELARLEGGTQDVEPASMQGVEPASTLPKATPSPLSLVSPPLRPAPPRTNRKRVVEPPREGGTVTEVGKERARRALRRAGVALGPMSHVATNDTKGR